MARDNNSEAPQAAQSWDDQLTTAMPVRSLYFTAVRTEAYENKNAVADYLEFWVAMQVDKNQDKWRVMHYMIFRPDQPDGKFRAEIAVRDKDGKPGDCSFPQALYHLNEFVAMASNAGTSVPFDMTPEKFPSDKFPEMKVYFFDIEHYKTAANILHVAFDDAGCPYRTIEGKVFAAATFKRSEIGRAITAPEQACDNPKIAVAIEKGITSDIFNAAAAPQASLGDKVKALKSLACLDEFALQMGAFYLGVQKLLNKDDKFDKLRGLTPEEKKSLYDKVSDLEVWNPADTLGEMMKSVMQTAEARLAEAKNLGIHVEPFQKHLAECDLYLQLLNAAQNLGKFEASLRSAHGADSAALAALEQSTKKAQEKFLQLGGTTEQFDRLQAWVANDRKEMVPPWVTGWFDRYYDQRHKAMQKIQNRTASAREITTLSTKVKPPIAE